MRHRLASKPLPLNHIPSDPARVALLVAVARAETDMLQRTLASSLHVSERTVQRLERGESPPAGHVCQKLVEVLSGATDETWNALVEALELPLEPPPASLAPPPDPPPAAAVSARIASSTTTHASFDDFLRAQADDLDVPASRLRAALEALLGELEARGLSFAQAREILAGARLGFGRGRKGRKF